MTKNRFKTKPIRRIKQKMQLTIPPEIIRALKLDIGTFVEFSIKEGKILLEPIQLANENPKREAELLAAVTRSRS